jgi:uncharacterized protein
VDQRLSLVTLGVADLDRARRFYEEGLGWKRANEEESVVFFQLPGMVLGLWSRKDLAEDTGLDDGGASFSGMTLAYNTRSRAEVDVVMAEAEKAGGRVLKPAAETFWGGYSGYFADPDGHPWEVAHNPFWSLDAEGRVSLAG